MPATASRVLVVFAHPDDEAYLAAGLMARTVAGGGVVRCVTATFGEGGFAAADPRSDRERRLVRVTELWSCLDVLGVSDHRVLGHPDGACDQLGDAAQVAVLEAELSAFEPDLTVTFEPWGVTGHPDHQAVSRWTTAAWVGVGVGALLYATHTESHLEEFAELNSRLGVFMSEPVPPGTPEREVVLDVDLDEHELDLKRRALGAHASQTAGLAQTMGESLYRRWVRRETFREPRQSELHAARSGLTVHAWAGASGLPRAG